jgi:hypothetical protein
MVLREVYFLIEDTINNSVDLISPTNGFTHKGTKATLYDLHTHEFREGRPSDFLSLKLNI